jgi:hypothetical protein
LFGTRELIVGFRELAARRLAIWASDGLVLRALVGRELKKRELLLTATGQRTHLILSIYPPALLCRRAFFTPRLCAFPGRELRMPAEVAAMGPAVAGTRGMNVNWEEKIVAPARDRQGEALRKMAFRRRIGYQCPGRPVVRLLRFIDIQLWLPQLRAVLRHDLWERRVVPTQHFRAIRPGSPVGPDAFPCPRY